LVPAAADGMTVPGNQTLNRQLQIADRRFLPERPGSRLRWDNPPPAHDSGAPGAAPRRGCQIHPVERGAILHRMWDSVRDRRHHATWM